MSATVTTPGFEFSKSGAGSNHFYLLHSLLKTRAEHPAIPVAVCWPHSTVSLAGAVEAAEAGLIDPILVGSQVRRALQNQPRRRSDEGQPAH